MTINGITVNTNAAASALTSYLDEVKKIAEKVNLSTEDVDMIIRLNRKNLKFQEVVQITGEPVSDVKENTAEPAPARATKNTFDLEYIASHKEAYEMIDPSKVVCLDNVKVRKPDVCNTFKMALAGLRKIGVKEVHYRFWCEPSEGINAVAKQSAMAVTEGKRSEDQERRYFYYKEMAKRNAANAQAQEVPMPEEPKKAKYMSAANMASLEASAPARVNKNSIMAAAKRLAAAKAKPVQAPAPVVASVATPAPVTVSETVAAPTPVKEDTQKQMSVEDYANEILAESGLDEWDVADITDSFKELCGSKAPEPEQVVETVTVVAPTAVATPADDDAETTFVVPSFEEMMGFGSVSTYVEKDGEVVVDDGKDTEDELTEEKKDELLAGVSLNGYTEETPYTIDDIPNMDAGRFEREYDKMLKCIEKGKVPTPYQEALLKEAEENRDAGFMRVEDTTLMVSARVR